MIPFIRRYGLYIIWVIATIASSTTFYLTEVQHWIPCHLCWYQQVCMLPLVFIAGMSAWYGFFGIVRYILPQTLIGFGLALYQVIIQIYTPMPCKLPPIEICKPGAECDEMLSFHCGLNLPLLSITAFFLINLLLFTILFVSKKRGFS